MLRVFAFAVVLAELGLAAALVATAWFRAARAAYLLRVAGAAAALAALLPGFLAYRDGSGPFVVAPAIAGVVILLPVLRSGSPGEGAGVASGLAALVALLPSLMGFLGPRALPAGSAPLAYVVFSAAGYGLLLGEGVKAVLKRNPRLVEERLLLVGLIMLLAGAISRAWYDYRMWGLYWGKGLAGKGGIVTLLVSAGLWPREPGARVKAIAIAIIALGALWGLSLWGI